MAQVVLTSNEDVILSSIPCAIFTCSLYKVGGRVEHSLLLTELLAEAASSALAPN